MWSPADFLEGASFCTFPIIMSGKLAEEGGFSFGSVFSNVRCYFQGEMRLCFLSPTLWDGPPLFISGVAFAFWVLLLSLSHTHQPTFIYVSMVGTWIRKPSKQESHLKSWQIHVSKGCKIFKEKEGTWMIKTNVT